MIEGSPAAGLTFRHSDGRRYGDVGTTRRSDAHLHVSGALRNLGYGLPDAATCGFKNRSDSGLGRVDSSGTAEVQEQPKQREENREYVRACRHCLRGEAATRERDEMEDAGPGSSRRQAFCLHRTSTAR